MSPLKRILIATDLSVPARQAADRAARLASAVGARLQLVHAINAGVAAQLQQLLGMNTALEVALMAQTGDALKTLAGEAAPARR